MIDIHSHILPAVDDGAKDLDQALQMLKLAAADGVRTQVLTPHIHIGRFNNTLSQLSEQFRHFKQCVQRAGIDIELILGAELRIGPEIIPLVQNRQIPWLGDAHGIKTLLLEFAQKEIPLGSENLVQWLHQQGIQCIIAHPERNRVFQQRPAKLQRYLQMGCALQLTAGSLNGRFGATTQQFAEQLLQQGCISLMASDCHNLSSRPPNLSQGLRAAASIIGQPQATQLVTVNPLKFLGTAPQSATQVVV